MQKIHLIKVISLTALFLATYLLFYYLVGLLFSYLTVESEWHTKLQYLLAVLLAFVTTYTVNRLSRQIYLWAQQVVLSLSLSDFIIGIISAVIGLIFGALVSVPLAGLPDPWSWISSLLVVILATVAAIWAFNIKKSTIIEWFESLPIFKPEIPKDKGEPKQKSKKDVVAIDEFVNPMVLDTSAIIDGRIAEIIKSGFMFGTYLVPNFILVELQQVADSSNAEKRQRGRRGLKMLQSLKRNKKIEIRFIDNDYADIELVDIKLVQLARDLKAKIITCDYNLNKVAKVKGIEILNVNELANYLRQHYLPGERIVLKVVQEGKEKNQGIGYLADGTMVVVGNGASKVGQEVEVIVERLLQTAAGKMLFVKLPE